MKKLSIHQRYMNSGYLLIELLISLLLFCLFSSVMMHIQFSVATVWRATLQRKNALHYAQTYLDALIAQKTVPEIVNGYAIEVSTHDFFPEITAVNFSCVSSLYKKKYSLISVACTWRNTTNTMNKVVVSSGGISLYEK